jgi:hypothetical protein
VVGYDLDGEPTELERFSLAQTQPDEARYVTEMARRIAAILLLGPR